MRSSLSAQFVAEVVRTEGDLGLRDFFTQGPVEPLPRGLGVPLREGTLVRARASAEGLTLAEEPLALPGGARRALYAIAAAHGLEASVSVEAQGELDRLLAGRGGESADEAPGLEDPALADLSHLPFVTIDHESSRDLDQALHIEREGEGYLVRYALADAAYYVRPGSALFERALARGASYYLPGLMLPMLPPELSTGIISLNPEVERRALVFQMHLDPGGACARTELLRAKIRSRAKLSYRGVQAFLDAPEGHPYAGRGFGPSLLLLQEVGEARILDARARDVAAYRRSAVQVDLEEKEDGYHAFVIYGDVRNEVERYNEQISLLCNVEGALLLRREEAEHPAVHPIYRVHPPPDPDRLQAFAGMTAALARLHGLPEAWIHRRSEGQSLAAYLAQLPSPSGEVEERVARAIHRQAVMTNLRSVFSEEAGAHHGVGAPVYARFSAPMREIVGIYLHMEAWEQELGAGGLDREESGGEENLRARVIEAANRARELQGRIERQANRLALDYLFEAELQLPPAERPVRRGTIMGLTRSKVHVLLDRPTVDVKLYVRDLERELGEGTHLDLGRSEVALLDREGEVHLRLGDPIALRLRACDQRRDRWTFARIRGKGEAG